MTYLRLEDWILTQKNVIGIDLSNNGEIDPSDNSRARFIRHNFMTDTEAMGYLSGLLMSGLNATIKSDAAHWDTATDPLNRKAFIFTVNGRDYTSGQIRALAALDAGVGAPGKWALDSMGGISFKADPIKPEPPPTPPTPVINPPGMFNPYQSVPVADPSQIPTIWTQRDKAMLQFIYQRIGGI
jgi:hypothetical protein